MGLYTVAKLLKFTLVKITRNPSRDEIANVNFLYGEIVHVLQNTSDSCMNSATDRRGDVLEHRFTKFSEITQCNGQLRRSWLFMVTDFGTNRKFIYDFLLVSNTTYLLSCTTFK